MISLSKEQIVFIHSEIIRKKAACLCYSLVNNHAFIDGNNKFRARYCGGENKSGQYL